MDDLNRENMAKLDAAGIPVVLIDSDIEPPPRRSRYDVLGAKNCGGTDPGSLYSSVRIWYHTDK